MQTLRLTKSPDTATLHDDFTDTDVDQLFGMVERRLQVCLRDNTALLSEKVGQQQCGTCTSFVRLQAFLTWAYNEFITSQARLIADVSNAAASSEQLKQVVRAQLEQQQVRPYMFHYNIFFCID